MRIPSANPQAVACVRGGMGAPKLRGTVRFYAIPGGTLVTADMTDMAALYQALNAINADAKYDRPFYAFVSYQWDTSKNNGNQYFPGKWYRIDNQNARDKHNWILSGTETVLPDALR